ncbi:MAG: adenosine deaminase [Cellulomonas sp.]
MTADLADSADSADSAGTDDSDETATGRIAALPTVLLHDHLDGGLRPTTIVELAEHVGLSLPTHDPAELAQWFTREAGTEVVDGVATGSLEKYLRTFEVTLGVMQTVEGLRRVAREAIVDLAADGVVHVEERFAPELHTTRGLGLQDVLDAVQQGFADGVAEAAEAGRSITVGTLVTAMRQLDRWDEVADLALANRDRGVVGFDIAGPERGFPATRHLSAFQRLREASFPVTVHAGEADGLGSIAAALHQAGASRLGHGVRIVDDIEICAPVGATLREQVESARLGYLAHWVRDHQVALEVCPTSNTQTGAARSVADHPITLLKHLGFAVTVNTDNRLQSATSMSRELACLVDDAGWSPGDLRDVTLTAARSSFLPHDDRQALVARIEGMPTRPIGRHSA